MQKFPKETSTTNCGMHELCMNINLFACRRHNIAVSTRLLIHHKASRCSHWSVFFIYKYELLTAPRAPPVQPRNTHTYTNTERQKHLFESRFRRRPNGNQGVFHVVQCLLLWLGKEFIAIKKNPWTWHSLRQGASDQLRLSNRMTHNFGWKIMEKDCEQRGTKLDSNEIKPPINYCSCALCIVYNEKWHIINGRCLANRTWPVFLPNNVSHKSVFYDLIERH